MAGNVNTAALSGNASFVAKTVLDSVATTNLVNFCDRPQVEGKPRPLLFQPRLASAIPGLDPA